jgi:hypothetical protein
MPVGYREKPDDTGGKAAILAILAIGLALVLEVWPRSRTSTKASVARGVPATTRAAARLIRKSWADSIECGNHCRLM